jgi:hypothetical protein
MQAIADNMANEYQSDLSKVATQMNNITKVDDPFRSE